MKKNSKKVKNDHLLEVSLSLNSGLEKEEKEVPRLCGSHVPFMWDVQKFLMACLMKKHKQFGFAWKGGKVTQRLAPFEL